MRVDDRSAWDTPLRVDQLYPRRGPARCICRQFLLQLAHLVAEPGGKLELQFRGGAVHLFGQLLDQANQVLGRRGGQPVRADLGRALAPCPACALGQAALSAARWVSASSLAIWSVMSAIFFRSGCGSMPCSVL